VLLLTLLIATLSQTAKDKPVNGLEPLFKADMQYRSESETDAVVAAEGHEGAYIGSGDGTVKGDRIRGKIRWSLWSGNCLYPLVRKGQPVPEGLHLCTLNPGGFIETKEGARIRFDGRGYGLRNREGSSDEMHGHPDSPVVTQDRLLVWIEVRPLRTEP